MEDVCFQRGSGSVFTDILQFFGGLGSGYDFSQKQFFVQFFDGVVPETISLNFFRFVHLCSSNGKETCSEFNDWIWIKNQEKYKYFHPTNLKAHE